MGNSKFYPPFETCFRHDELDEIRQSFVNFNSPLFILYFCRMTQLLDSLFNGQQYDEKNFFLIAGPCVVESEEIVFEVAEKVSAISKRLQIPYVLKASFRKANRTSANSFTGLGDEKGLEILQKVAKHFSLPCTTDIHSEKDAAMAAPYVDI